MPERKRNYGSGSMRERSPSVWQLRVAAGSDPVTGKPRTVTETVHGSRKVAQQRLNELAAQHSGKPGTTTATLGTLIERWLATSRLADGSVRNYRNALNHLPDRFSELPLDRVGAHELDTLYSTLERKGVGTPTIRILHAALSSALSQAVRWRWLQTNPARNATPPPPVRRREVAPDADTLRRLMAGTADDPQLALWLRLSIVTGARRSEILALRWQDIHTESLNHSVTIAGSLEVDRRRKTTKSGDQRHVSIDDGTVAALERWRLMARERALAVGSKLTPTCYVLSDDPAGRAPWRPDRASKLFARLCHNTGVEGVRLHDLRHAAATTLLAAGVDLATVSGRLGHSRSSTTLDVYAHVPRGGDRRAAEIAAAILDTGTTSS